MSCNANESNVLHYVLHYAWETNNYSGIVGCSPGHKVHSAPVSYVMPETQRLLQGNQGSLQDTKCLCPSSYQCPSLEWAYLRTCRAK